MELKGKLKVCVNGLRFSSVNARLHPVEADSDVWLSAKTARLCIAACVSWKRLSPDEYVQISKSQAQLEASGSEQIHLLPHRKKQQKRPA